MEALTFGVPQAHSVGIVVGTSKKKARKQLDVKGRHSLNRIYSETFMQVIAEYPELNDLTFKKLYYTDKFNEIRVVWLGFGDERDEKAKKIFDEKFHVINKQMSDLLMGSIVPPLKFISERTNNILSKIEKRLQEADFGPDYVPGSQSPLNLGSTAKESVSMIKEEDMPKWKRMYIKRHKLDIPLKSDPVD
uniref:Uncharacterized protein n=1 Tax=Acrobeloides nanus TaxID=290746 RepID=A0A914DUB7_9BILA